MNTDKDGGNAFSIPGLQDDPDFNGLSVRDYFAAKALATASGYAADDISTWTAEDFARHAYAIADAMLRVRGAQ